MKILFLSDDFPPQSFGGAGIIAYNDAHALKNHGHSVTVITTTDKKENVGQKMVEGMRVHVLYSRYHIRWRSYVSLNNRPVVRQIENIIKEFKPDVVHAHNIHIHISYKALVIAKKYTHKVFLTAHDVMMIHYGKMLIKQNKDSGRVKESELAMNYGFRYNPFRNWIIKKYIRNVTRIFAVSNALKNVLEKNGIANIEVLHNGIDVDAWKTDAEAVTTFKTEHGLLATRNILFGGRLSALKGGQAMMDAFSILSQKIPEARLLVVGKMDDYAEKLRASVSQKETQDKIIFLGWVDRLKMKTVYGAVDVVAVPSLYLDPFPTVNLEAMATQKPVVGTCFGGTPELVLDTKTGFIVDPNNTSLFAEKLSELLSDDVKRERFGKAGYERVAVEFTTARHTQSLLSWYTDPLK